MCENEALVCDFAQIENDTFVREFLQKLKIEDVKMMLSCETYLRNWELKL